MFLNSSLPGRFVVQAPSDESVSPPKITISLSISSVGDEKFLPEDPSCKLILVDFYKGQPDFFEYLSDWLVVWARTSIYK